MNEVLDQIKAKYPCLLLVFYILISAFATSKATPSFAQTKIPTVSVVTTSCPPFVVEEAGEFSGLSIFLLDKISEQLEIDYQIEGQSLEIMLEIISSGKADLGISCLSVNHEREKRMDFSHSYYETNLAIAIKQRGYLRGAYNFLFSSKLLVALGIIACIALLIGGIFSMLEHKINPKLFSMKGRFGKLVEAFTIGLLFVASGPIRYYEFKTSTARLFSAILAIGSTVMIASFTAVLASAFTLDQLRTEITSPQNLRGTRVGVLDASTSAVYLTENGISHITFDDKKDMMASLDAGKLDAVVSDAAFLKYEISQAKKSGKFEELSVLPYEFSKQFYAIALPEGSPHIEQLNQALLKVRNSHQWKQQVKFFLGR
jgi:polar amino acid transport system substrate-binding protein